VAVNNTWPEDAPLNLAEAILLSESSYFCSLSDGMRWYAPFSGHYWPFEELPQLVPEMIAAAQSLLRQGLVEVYREVDSMVPNVTQVPPDEAMEAVNRFENWWRPDSDYEGAGDHDYDVFQLRPTRAGVDMNNALKTQWPGGLIFTDPSNPVLVMGEGPANNPELNVDFLFAADGTLISKTPRGADEAPPTI
jgi:hypothetical protein